MSDEATENANFQAFLGPAVAPKRDKDEAESDDAKEVPDEQATRKLGKSSLSAA